MSVNFRLFLITFDVNYFYFQAAGGGGAKAAPIARKVMMAYFGLEEEAKK
jgi:hypothetical protein